LCEFLFVINRMRVITYSCKKQVKFEPKKLLISEIENNFSTNFQNKTSLIFSFKKI